MSSLAKAWKMALAKKMQLQTLPSMMVETLSVLPPGLAKSLASIDSTSRSRLLSMAFSVERNSATPSGRSMASKSAGAWAVCQAHLWTIQWSGTAWLLRWIKKTLVRSIRSQTSTHSQKTTISMLSWKQKRTIASQTMWSKFRACQMATLSLGG